jgi:hypothetical protein
VHEARDPTWGVAIRTDSSAVRIGKDQLRFRIRSDRAGYLYLLMLGTDSSHFYLLFPNSLDSGNRLKAGVEVQLPRPGWAMVAGGPAGTNRFIALVTPTPRDFDPVGLRKTAPFGEFDIDIVGRTVRAEGAAAIAGRPVDCRDSAPSCAKFGAARFEIREID